jgi:hypothetical protein
LNALRCPLKYVDCLIDRREESNAQFVIRTCLPDDGMTYVQQRILKDLASIKVHGPHLESMARPTTDDGDQDGVAAEGSAGVAAAPGLHLQVPHGYRRRRNRRPVLDRHVLKESPL